MANFSSAVVQTTNRSFDFNGESSLDLEYGMGLTNPQPITLLQVGDLLEGWLTLNPSLIIAANILQYYTGGGFDNWLDAVDGSYCGGDDPIQVNCYYLWPYFTIVNYFFRMVYIQILCPVDSTVGTSSKTWFQCN